MSDFRCCIKTLIKMAPPKKSPAAEPEAKKTVKTVKTK